MMSLQTLLQYQLSAGLSEQELAKDIGVPKATIHEILQGRDPKNPDNWKKLARYFHKDLNLLRFEHFGFSNSRGNGPVSADHENPYRQVPILLWRQLREVVKHKGPLPFLASGQRMVETELPGMRVFALKVQDDSMAPLFHRGELIFVNPDLRPQAGDYVIVFDQRAETDPGNLRQLKRFQQQYVLHPLNRRYKDNVLTKHQKIVGRVVRLRMDL